MRVIWNHAATSSCHGRRRSFLLALLMGLALVSPAAAQTLQDFFTNRVTITTLTGQIKQSNTNATIEPGEPKHGGKTGGHSLWISWVAPTNGVARFKTEASGFDTLLAAYQFTTNGGTTFAQLREVARADDTEGLERESEIEFGVRTGERYEVAVDGYFGAVGFVDFQWAVQTLTNAPPQILNTLADRAVNVGDTVSLAFNVTNSGAGSYKWYLNDNEIDGANATTLTVTNFSPARVGRYKMRVLISGGGGVQYYSMPIEVQINTEGLASTLAQGKILDAPSTPLIGIGGGSFAPFTKTGANGGPGIVRGYNGTQIFDTTYATIDPNEPAHCGVSNGYSYWLIYQPPANGEITLDTIGSTYDTVMEVYTFNGAVTGYGDLISLSCENDSFGTNGPSRATFGVVKTRQYLVAVEGVAGARGRAWLNYTLNTNKAPTTPQLLTPAGIVSVAAGTNVALGPDLMGTPPLKFSWRKNLTTLSNVVTPGIYLPGVTTNDAADYTVTVTNDLGSLTATWPLHVVTPPVCAVANSSGELSLRVPTVTGLQYFVEQATNIAGPWASWTNNYSGNGAPLVIPLTGGGTGFFRVRVF